jgi:hypothetical protein
MSCQIQINSITGTPPFNIFLCDITFNQCILNLSAVTPSYPLILTLPPTLENTDLLIIQIVDYNNCSVFHNYVRPSLTPTPTNTTTPTPTPSLYSTPTPTPTPSSS